MPNNEGFSTRKVNAAEAMRKAVAAASRPRLPQAGGSVNSLTPTLRLAVLPTDFSETRRDSSDHGRKIRV